MSPPPTLPACSSGWLPFHQILPIPALRREAPPIAASRTSKFASESTNAGKGEELSHLTSKARKIAAKWPYFGSGNLLHTTKLLLYRRATWVNLRSRHPQQRFSPNFRQYSSSERFLQHHSPSSCAQAHTLPRIIISKFAPESKIFQKVDNLSTQTAKSQGEALNEAREGL